VRELATFFSNNPDSHVCSLDHRDIVASVTDTTDSLFCECPDDAGDIGFLDWCTLHATTTGRWTARDMKSSLYEVRNSARDSPSVWRHESVLFRRSSRVSYAALLCLSLIDILA